MGTANKPAKVNKRTGSSLDREPGFDEYHADKRRKAGVEIRPAGKDKENKKY